jgi:hypothetical protein
LGQIVANCRCALSLGEQNCKFAFVPQVLPSFKKFLMGIIDKDAEVSAETTVRLQSEMSKLLAKHGGSDGSRPKRAPATNPKVSSYELLRGLDHALVVSGCGGLAAFLPYLHRSSRLLFSCSYHVVCFHCHTECNKLPAPMSTPIVCPESASHVESIELQPRSIDIYTCVCACV